MGRESPILRTLQPIKGLFHSNEEVVFIGIHSLPFRKADVAKSAHPFRDIENDLAPCQTISPSATVCIALPTLLVAVLQGFRQGLSQLYLTMSGTEPGIFLHALHVLSQESYYLLQIMPIDP